MEDENSWFTITPTLEHRKRPAKFRRKDVTPVSRRAFWWSWRCWNLHASAVIWILGQYPHQGCFKENFAKIFTRSHRPQHSNSRTRTMFFICSTNRLLCGQHNIPQLLQESVYGHVWTSCLCLGILWNIILLLPVYQAHR